jgi:hypothetical protein
MYAAQSRSMQQQQQQQQQLPQEQRQAPVPTQQQKQAKSIHQQMQMQQQALRQSYQEHLPRQNKRQQQQQQQQQQQEEQSFMLPSTMVPPSVLASMCGVSGSSNKTVPAKANCGKPPAKKKRPARKYIPGEAIETPQSVLMHILKQRKHSFPTRIKADDVGYDAVPSALQLASFGTHLVRAVHTSDPELLSELLECGLSPNPCNQFRDSIVDLVCKRGNNVIFKCLLEHGCDLQVVDGFGRTPLHHASWASSFCRPIVEAIMEVDPVQFFLEDKHGQTPLEYVRVDLYPDWIEFLQEMADVFWPIGSQSPQLQSPKRNRPEGTLPDPQTQTKNGIPFQISTSLAALVSAGAMTPQQVMDMDDNQRKNYSTKNKNNNDK